MHIELLDDEVYLDSSKGADEITYEALNKLRSCSSMERA